jgi:thymidylate synthase (FAD)
MQLVEPYVTIIEEKDPYKKIELAGRTCYKSENKISEDSAKKFVKSLINRKHEAMLEHQVFVFEVYDDSASYTEFLRRNNYLHVTSEIVCDKKNNYRNRVLVSGNVRAICQRGMNDPIYRALYKEYPDLCYSVNPSSIELFDYADARIVDIEKEINSFNIKEIIEHVNFTFRIITDRRVTHELIRHRLCSFAQESTRYVNYKDGLSIALPSGFYDRPSEVQLVYQKAFEAANRFYHDLIEYCGQTPQQARAVLPNATKTEIVVTTNLKEWKHIINLRYFGTTGAPHPDIKFVIEKVFNELKKDKLIGDLLEKEM